MENLQTATTALEVSDTFKNTMDNAKKNKLVKVVSELREPLPQRLKLSDMPANRVELLTYLLDCGATKVIPAWLHPKASIDEGYKPVETYYGLEVKVAQEIRSLFPENNLEIVSEINSSILGWGVLAIGSPVSNPYAANYLGDPKSKFTRAHSAWWSADLAYRFVTPSDAPIVKRYQYGRLWEVPNTILMGVNGTPYIPKFSPDPHDTKKFWLKTDYLMLTRLPGLVNGGGDIIIAAGTHGIGTKAIGILLQKISLKDLEDVREETNGSPYYQAVFEVPEITHNMDLLSSEPSILVKSKSVKSVGLKIELTTI